MTRTSQKVSEYRAVQRLVERLAILGASLEEAQHPDASPDVVVQIPSKLIGVEVTRYDGGPNKRDALKEQLYFLLCKKLDELIRSSPSMKGIDVDVYSSDNSALTRKKIDRAASLIFDAIKDQSNEFNEKTKWLKNTAITKYVRLVGVKRAQYAAEFYLPTHSDLHGAWVSIPKDSISEIISKKSLSYRECRHRGRDFDEYWLLITDGVGFRGSLNTPGINEFFEFEDIFPVLDGSAFSRCFLLCDNSAVFELTQQGVKQRALYHNM